MSAITAASATTRRPATITAAIVLLVLLGLSVLVPVPGLEEVPQGALIIGFAFAALKIIAAVGLWWCKKWAAILGFVVVLLDALLAVPGIVFGPTIALQVYTIVGVIISVAILVLLILPATRRAYA